MTAKRKGTTGKDTDFRVVFLPSDADREVITGVLIRLLQDIGVGLSVNVNTAEEEIAIVLSPEPFVGDDRIYAAIACALDKRDEANDALERMAKLPPKEPEV